MIEFKVSYVQTEMYCDCFSVILGKKFAIGFRFISYLLDMSVKTSINDVFNGQNAETTG